MGSDARVETRLQCNGILVVSMNWHRGSASIRAFVLGCGILSVSSLAAAQEPALSYANGAVNLEVKGLVDFRAVRTDDAIGWLDGGQGKTRYGGSREGGRRTTGAIGEASAIIDGQFGSNTSAYLHLKHDREQSVPIDVVEGFVQFRPVSTSAWRFNAKVGAFFPPVSMENVGLAWQSPYTITWSAINSWVGEEVRSLGGELAAEYRYQGGRVELGGSLYAGNDPTGTILSKRGWALHDRATTLADDIPMPAQNAGLGQGGKIELIEEIDDRPGYYLFARASDEDIGGELLLTYYDNNADDAATRNGQDAWLTRFAAAGTRYSVPLPVDLEDAMGLEFLAQGMTGVTKRTNGPGDAGKIDVRFHSVYAMLSAEFGDRLPQRFSVRWDGFSTEDRRPLQGGPLIYDESGQALTVSYSMFPWDGHRFTAEMVTVESDRPARDGAGDDRTERETNFILNYRFSF